MGRPINVEDMVWAIRMLMMSDKEIKRMLMTFRNAILNYNKQPEVNKKED